MLYAAYFASKILPFSPSGKIELYKSAVMFFVLF